jgi:diguanylate cyclase (GGDEF)-like protein/PAS domain S-box-containing protein
MGGSVASLCMSQLDSRPSVQSAPSRVQRARRALVRLLKRARRPMTRQSLRTTIAILKAQQEATVDGILVIDHDGRILTYNRRFLEIWGIPESVAANADDNELLGYAAELVEDWDSFIELVNYLYANPDEVRTDDPVHLKDGRVLARTSVPVTTEGKHAARAWYFRDVTEAKRAERLQSALFRIAQLSRESEDLDHFYAAIHNTIGELMDATNFYIAEVDGKRGVVNFPYFVDQYDPRPVDIPIGHGLTAYVLRTGMPLFATPRVFEELIARGEVTAVGAPSVDWIGVPLKSGDETWGVIGVQSYDLSIRYRQRDVDILGFVAQHVASAIEQKRKEDAVRASERRYRQMFENNRAVQLLLDPTSGEIVDVNMAACDFYGYTYDELCSMRIWEINVLGEEAVRTEMANASAQQRSYFVFRHKRATGEIRDVEVHSGPIDVGERRLLYSIIHDITERKHAEERLATSNAQRKAVLDAATRVSIIASDPEGTITVFNAGAERMLGYTADEMIGKHTLLDLHDPSELREHAAGLEHEFRRAIGGFDILAMRAAIFGLEEREWTFVKKNGETGTVHVAVTAIRGEDKSITGFLHVATDVTARKQAEEMLRKQSAAMQASMDGMGILNERLDFTYANEALARLFGFNDPHDIVGKNLCDLYEPPEQVRFVTIIMPQVLQRGRWRGEASGWRRDGAQFPQEISLTLLDEGGFVCVVRDITERTYAEEQIKHLAYHDALTGLPNRLLFKDRVTVALSHAQRDNSRLAVLFLDLDRFKVINDSLGHNIGDQLLQAVASRVQSCVRDSDTLARLGGDEFTLLLPGLVRSDDAAPIADKILDAVRLPFHIEGREFYITTSIGISLYPEDGSDAESLIKNADTAMYQAKEQGRDNYQLFNAYVNARALQRITLEHGLRRALAADELEVHYQPIYDFRSGRISGMEALLRWTHPDLGPIPPAVFIPLAESTGAMVPIGAWVLRSACAQAKAWHEAGFRSLSLAVNLSVTQLHQGDLVERVRQILEETQLPPRLLELEITESSAMLSPETSIRTLYDLKKLGLRISLDDFGTGHSSLSYLKRFPIDTLKIDQSFVRDINSDPDTAAIVTAIIAMAHSLRLKVIAEGVELTEQANFLRRYGCDQMQGYLVKPPVAATEFVTILEQPA